MIFVTVLVKLEEKKTTKQKKVKLRIRVDVKEMKI